MFLPIVEEKNQSRFEQPTAILVYNGQQINIPLGCIFINGQEINFPEKGLDGCLRIIPIIQGQEVNPIGAGIYVSPKQRNTLFAKLYLFDQEGEYFKIAYNDKESMPLAIYNGRVIGPLKIWNISYPDDLEVPEKYLVDKLPDPNVENLEGQKTLIANYQTQINTHVSSILNSTNSLRNTLTGNDLAVKQAESQLKLAQIELDNAQISLDNAQNSANLEKIIAQTLRSW